MGRAMRVVRKAMSCALAACLTIGATPPAALAKDATPALEAQASTTERLAGSDRYATMAAIVREAFPSGSEWAVVATGEGFADALCASALAGARRCPVVLTAKGSLPKAAKDELKRLGAKKAYVVGGKGAVSATVESGLKDMGIDVTRISGADRYATSAAVAREVRRIASPKSVAVVTGSSFADALSLGPWCYATASPVLCVPKGGKLSGEALKEATSGGYSSAVIAGGKSAVSPLVEPQLKGMSVERLAGENRYETSASVAKWSCTHGLSWKYPALATGRNFPDALAGAALQGVSASPLLLVDAASDPTATLLRSAAQYDNTIRVLGGTGALSDALVNAVINPGDSQTRARTVADTLVEGDRSRSYSTYRFADVYGGAEEELLLSIKSEQGSGWTLYVYTFEGGTRQLYKHGGIPDEWYDFYKDGPSLVAHGGGHGSEWYYAATMVKDSYQDSARMTRRPSSKYGESSDGPWTYWTKSAGDCDETTYKLEVASLERGEAIRVSGSDWLLIYG